MTVAGLLGYFTKWLFSLFTNKLGIKCPHCQTIIPALHPTCPGCGATLTAREVVKETIGPDGKRIQNLVAPTTFKMRLFLWFFPLASVIVFWHVLGLLEMHYASGWFKRAALSVIFLSFFLLVARISMPRQAFVVIARLANGPVKLGLVFNYLTGLCLFQMYLSSWWSRSVMLAGLFIATWVSAFLFWRVLWGTFVGVGAIFVPPDSDQTFDPRAPQGRKIEQDQK